MSDTAQVSRLRFVCRQDEAVFQGAVFSLSPEMRQRVEVWRYIGWS